MFGRYTETHLVAPITQVARDTRENADIEDPFLDCKVNPSSPVESLDFFFLIKNSSFILVIRFVLFFAARRAPPTFLKSSIQRFDLGIDHGGRVPTLSSN